MKVNYTILSRTIKLTDKDSKKLLSKAYQTTNWKIATTEGTLDEVLKLEALVSIKTDNITVIDFDTDLSFQQALEFNDALRPEYQCNFIVRSKRKGGHFYFSPNSSIPPAAGHTKQAVLDILTTDKHNVIAPTSFDQGKEIIKRPPSPITLTQYSPQFNLFVEYIVRSNISEASQAQIYLSSTDTDHSDDNIDFLKGYLSDVISQEEFHEFYHIKDPIPEGMSNQEYLRLSTRLGCDVTVDIDTYIKVMDKFNSYHQRKNQEELLNEITGRMVNNKNGLWKYEERQKEPTLAVLHRTYNTKMYIFYSSETSEYLVEYTDSTATKRIKLLRSPSMYIEYMEKVTTLSRKKLRDTTKRIEEVTYIHDYSKPEGYDKRTRMYNTAIRNHNLRAFAGEKPQDYVPPTKLLEILKYMWDEEYDYMLAMTKYRYSTFEFSPVVTFLQGTEGSGKDLTINLLSAGFSNSPQQINYVLLKDKHSNWQTEENAVFSEVGSWRPIEQDDMLSNLKTISGSNGKVTFRGMQRTATTVDTIVKIWVTGNEWIKLHTDPLTQRRIHVVYMPKPLTQSMDGPYSTEDITEAMTPQSIVNFYYWLGNEYEGTITPAQYREAISRHHTRSYKTYIDATQSRSDKASSLIWEQNYEKFKEALSLYNISLTDLDWKYTKQKQLVIASASLKEHFSMNSGTPVISKTIDRISEVREGGKRLKFNRPIIEKYITIYGAPKDLSGVEADPITIEAP